MSKNRTTSPLLSALLSGLKDGFPIGLGYFAVSFALGIYAKKSGFSPIAGFIYSFLTHASAGEYAGYLCILEKTTFIGTAFVILVTNARYLLMGTALSQRLPDDLPMRHRVGIGFLITDEIFAAVISRKGTFQPFYMYGIGLIALTLWAMGTALGVIFGNILPANVVSALSVALYGMFLAVIIPAGKKEHHLFIIIAVSFILSFVCEKYLLISMSSGMRTIVLTIVISTLAALVFPRKETDDEA